MVSEQKFFEGRVYGHKPRRTNDGHNAMTIARWHSASGAKNDNQMMHYRQWTIDTARSSMLTVSANENSINTSSYIWVKDKSPIGQKTKAKKQ